MVEHNERNIAENLPTQAGQPAPTENRTGQGKDPFTGQPDAHPASTTGGAAVGGGTGAAIGGAIGGPIGAAAGAVIGAIAGGGAGHQVADAAQASLDESEEAAYWHTWHTEHGKLKTPADYQDQPFEDYLPAYRIGWQGAARHRDRPFEEVEGDLRREWETQHGSSNLDWERAREASRRSWERTRQRLGQVDAGDFSQNQKQEITPDVARDVAARTPDQKTGSD